MYWCGCKCVFLCLIFGGIVCCSKGMGRGVCCCVLGDVLIVLMIF